MPIVRVVDNPFPTPTDSLKARLLSAIPAAIGNDDHCLDTMGRRLYGNFSMNERRSL